MGIFKRLINGFLQSDDVILNTDGSVPVAIVSAASSPAAAATAAGAAPGTDRSGTAGTSSSALMAANAARRNFYIKNDSTIDIWINPSATATATAGNGNIKVPANGGYFEQAFSTSAWSVIAASATAAYTAREF